MPLTHDIGVRIPYPLLETDNRSCLFFCFVPWLIMQTIRLAAYTCLALFAFASELAGNHLKPQPAVWSASLRHSQAYVVDSALLTGWGCADKKDFIARLRLRYTVSALLCISCADRGWFYCSTVSALQCIRATATQFESHIKTVNFGCLFFCFYRRS